MPQVPRRPGPGRRALRAHAERRRRRPIFAADLTQNWRFNGGGTVEDIYHRLRTGSTAPRCRRSAISSTRSSSPMSSCGGSRSTCASLSPSSPRGPRRSFTRPGYGTSAALPADSAWSRIESYWFPLVGQVGQKDPLVRPGGERCARAKPCTRATHSRLRVVWDDRSQSPDSAWLGHIGRVLARWE